VLQCIGIVVLRRKLWKHCSFTGNCPTCFTLAYNTDKDKFYKTVF